MPFAVAGRTKPCCWGIWVEVSKHDYRRTNKLWESPHQHLEKPFPAHLANNIEGYPRTLGLPGLVQLKSPTAIPVFILDPGAHPLIAEQTSGVTETVVMAWLKPILHPSAPAA
jgi:hypothetical protein